MSGQDVLVVLMNYARPQNMPRVVSAWKNQSEKPGRLIVVDNSPSNPSEYTVGGKEGYPGWQFDGADDVWRFTDDLGCFGRLAPALVTPGYGYTLFADDDLLPGPKALEGLLHWAGELRGDFATLGQLGRRIDFAAPAGKRYVTRNWPRDTSGPVQVDLTCRVHLCQSHLLPDAVRFRSELLRGAARRNESREYDSLAIKSERRSGKVVCPGCDGTGRISHQWAKEAWLQDGGTGQRKLSGGGIGYVYWTKDGREIPFMAVNGPCGVCGGEKVVVNPPRLPSSPQEDLAAVQKMLTVHDDILLAVSSQECNGPPSYVIPVGDPERELIAVDLDDGKGLWRRPGHFAERNAVVDLCVAAGWKRAGGANRREGG